MIDNNCLSNHRKVLAQVVHHGRHVCEYLFYVKLVDPASSHMLVLKIKPCMFKFIPLNGETANGSLNQL